MPPPEAAVDAPTDAPALAPCADPVAGTTVRLRRVGTIGSSAVLATAPIGDRRLFVVGQAGQIRIFDETEALLPEPFIDLDDDSGGPVVFQGNEQGLLGLAFHPEYAANGTFFVFYTRRTISGEVHPQFAFRNVLARCQRSASDPDKADAASCVDLLAIPDSQTNHNGGMIEFGADGFLYIGTGDGGGSNDPAGNAQALADNIPTATVALLGKLLRIDVDTKAPGLEYGIPAGNPFAGGGGPPEVLALGLRNPWRWSFDRATGDLWLADVGQQEREELNVVPAAELAGHNFGWDIWEGSRCVAGGCSMTGFTFPLAEKTHAPVPTGDGWEAIVGGQVYRGTCFPDFVGTYLFADNGGRVMSSAKLQADGTLAVTNLLPAPGEAAFPGNTASMHADARGEIFLTTTAGEMFQIVAGPP